MIEKIYHFFDEGLTRELNNPGYELVDGVNIELPKKLPTGYYESIRLDSSGIEHIYYRGIDKEMLAYDVYEIEERDLLNTEQIFEY